MITAWPDRVVSIVCDTATLPLKLALVLLQATDTRKTVIEVCASYMVGTPKAECDGTE